MGVVNVTPDSFSDGGLSFAADAAVAHGLALLEQGADIVDVGGESTLPQTPSQGTPFRFARRGTPAGRGGTATRPARRAGTGRGGCDRQCRHHAGRGRRPALDAGARLVNDVSGGLADPGMLPLMARAGTPYVLMHWRGHSAGMQANAVYDDVVTDVLDELRLRIDAALEAGIPPGCLVVDPGLGFAKTPDHNWELLGRLGDVMALGHPVLVGASCKSFLGSLLADRTTGQPRPARLRDAATTAVSVLAAAQGVWCLRVHDVASTADAVRVTARWGVEAAASARSPLD
ncbi:dihydropteroate synthase [Streptomyces sp. A012304]|nr:dihydropteroate synthase [Streptomyces sp. A012304]